MLLKNIVGDPVKSFIFRKGFCGMLLFYPTNKPKMVIRIWHKSNGFNIARRKHQFQLAKTENVFPETVLLFFNILNRFDRDGVLAVFHQNRFFNIHNSEIRNNHGLQKMFHDFNKKRVYKIAEQRNRKDDRNLKNRLESWIKACLGKENPESKQQKNKNRQHQNSRQQRNPVMSEKRIHNFLGVLPLKVKILESVLFAVHKFVHKNSGEPERIKRRKNREHNNARGINKKHLLQADKTKKQGKAVFLHTVALQIMKNPLQAENQKKQGTDIDAENCPE